MQLSQSPGLVAQAVAVEVVMVRHEVDFAFQDERLELAAVTVKERVVLCRISMNERVEMEVVPSYGCHGNPIP